MINLNFRKKFGAKFFNVDIFDEFGNVIQKVGTAEERVIRRQAFTVRKIARRSMRKQRYYKAESEMPLHLAGLFHDARVRWHIMGEDPMYEPVATKVRRPSPPGKPPGVVKGQLKKFLLAERGRKSFSSFGVGPSFVVGPKLLPGKKRRGATTPEAHEHGKAKFNDKTILRPGIMANYPKRPYMDPALTIAMPRFARMWQGQVRS